MNKHSLHTSYRKVIPCMLAVTAMLAMQSCGGKKSEAAAPAASTAPAPVATAAPAPKATPAPVAATPAPVAAAAPAETPAPAPVEAPATVEQPVAVATPAPKAEAPAEPQTIMLNDGVKLVVYPDHSMKTFYGNLLIFNTPVVSLTDTEAGKEVVYADGVRATVGAQSAVIDLGNGIVVTVDTEGEKTTFNGQVLTTLPIIGYQLEEDGTKELTYEGGIHAAVSGDGVTISLDNGLSFAVTADGTETKYFDLPVSESPIVGFDTGSDAVTLTYQDGIKASLSGDDMTVTLPIGLGLVFSPDHTLTTYQDSVVTDMPVASFAYAEDGVRKLTYEDGTELSFGEDTFDLSLPVGLEFSLSGDGATTTFAGLTLEKSAIDAVEFQDGIAVVTYRDGTQGALSLDGKAAMVLPNGLGLMTAGGWTSTTIRGMQLSATPLETYAYDDGVRTLTYVDGMVVKSEDEGALTVTFADGLTIAAASEDDMTTSWNGLVLTKSPADGVMLGNQGEHVVHYTNGDLLAVADGTAAMFVLPDGLALVTDGSAWGTMFGGVTVSEQAVTAYAYDDGTRTLTYADGLVLSTSENALTAVDAPNGLHIALDADGATTSYLGTVVTRSALAGYAYDETSRTLTYQDGMSARFDDDGTVFISYPYAFDLYADADGMITRYGADIDESPLVGYVLADDGEKRLAFADGLTLVLNADGSVKSAVGGPSVAGIR